MDKQHCLKLCLAVYKITKPFSEKEPLKFNIRKRANDILTNLFSINPTILPLDKKRLFKDVEILNAYFDIAQQQNWVNPDNFTILKREFNKLKQDFSEENTTDKAEERDQGNQGDHGNQGNMEKIELQGRQKKILEIIKRKKECQISDFEDIFSGISRRTIQRDLEILVRQGLIKKQGEYKDIFYTFSQAI